MRKVVLFLCLGLFGAVIMTGCSKKEKMQARGLTIFTSILPQKYFVEKIGGERVSVNVLVGPGKSPATYEVLPDQVTTLGTADVLFTIGVPFEKGFLPKICSSLKKLKIIDTSKGINKRLLKAHSHAHDDAHEEHHEDEHHEDDEHEAGHHAKEAILDPHIWMSPSLVKKQALIIYQTLIELDPDGKVQYKKGYDELIEELVAVDKKLAQVLTPYEGQTLFVFHPAFGYLADQYGIKQLAIETGGKQPSPALLEEIILHAKEEKVKIIFVQPEFSQKSAQAVADAIEGSVVMLSPLNPDYINNLLHMANEIKKGYQ